jgi:hypothetical protein
MKPHPLIRKTIKRGGEAVCVIAIAAYLLSFGWPFRFFRGTLTDQTSVQVCNGSLNVLHDAASGRPPDTHVTWLAVPVHWEGAFVPFKWRSGPPAFWQLVVPLWMPLVVVLGTAGTIAIVLIRADGRPRPNLCTKCNYDRTGLAPDAKCPECGASAGGPA